MRGMRIAIRVVCLSMVIVLATVSVWYIGTIMARGDRWINSANNSRIAAARKTTIQGTVTDRTGMVLTYSTQPGQREYLADTSYRRALSHTLGDQKGQSSTGVEMVHAATLLGLTTTRAGRALELLSGSDPKGANLQLTVDAELTAYIARQFPQNAYGEPYAGAVCIINYRTGEILVMVSMPDYDPADMTQFVRDGAYVNRVLQGRYAPGSVFKIITLAAALAYLPGVTEETFDCYGSWDYGAKRPMSCAGGTAHGTMTLMQAFAKSCNVTFGGLGNRVGAEALRQTAESFRFNDNFRFPDTILYQSTFSAQLDTATKMIQTGIGQGETLVTPLHMAMIAGTIANGGIMMAPKLIRAVTRADGTLQSVGTPEPYATVISSDMAWMLARYMYEAVQSGTGTRARISGYTGGYVCGKTGSAEVSDDKSIPTHAWYVGFLYEDEAHPYAIATIIEHGGSGGQLAATLSAQALAKAIERNL